MERPSRRLLLAAAASTITSLCPGFSSQAQSQIIWEPVHPETTDNFIQNNTKWHPINKTNGRSVENTPQLKWEAVPTNNPEEKDQSIIKWTQLSDENEELDHHDMNSTKPSKEGTHKSQEKSKSKGFTWPNWGAIFIFCIKHYAAVLIGEYPYLFICYTFFN